MSEYSARCGLVFDDCFQRHDPGAGHPERPARLQAIREGLESAGLIQRCAPIALREATDALGEVTGRVTGQDVLDRIFSRFCVGK